MRTRLLTQLVEAPNLDYVENFQVLSALNLEIRRHGPSAERMLRKAMLEMGVGNYAACLSAALDAQAMDPASPETHYQVGLANFLIALARSGAVPGGPGMGHPADDEPASRLLAKSIEAFREAVRVNPGDDETAQDVAILQQLQVDCDTESKLLTALRRSLK
ncbi:MAG: hypothetical protein V4510_08970 [bacterium]